MKKSEIFAKNNQDLRNAVLGEIGSLVRQHSDQKLLIHFKTGVFFSPACNEQDSPHLIEEVSETHAVVHHNGYSSHTVRLSDLHIEMLIQIVDALEKSFASANKVSHN